LYDAYTRHAGRSGRRYPRRHSSSRLYGKTQFSHLGQSGLHPKRRLRPSADVVRDATSRTLGPGELNLQRIGERYVGRSSRAWPGGRGRNGRRVHRLSPTPAFGPQTPTGDPRSQLPCTWISRGCTKLERGVHSDRQRKTIDFVVPRRRPTTSVSAPVYTTSAQASTTHATHQTRLTKENASPK